jgi:CDP-diacylglycerol---glycerol-3-phosphate 3-phosphatidyltransferase
MMVAFIRHPVVVLCIFLLAAGTDLADGPLARKLQAVSTFGQRLDPLADMVLAAAALVCVWSADVYPVWLIMTMMWAAIACYMLQRLRCPQARIEIPVTPYPLTRFTWLALYAFTYSLA